MKFISFILVFSGLTVLAQTSPTPSPEQQGVQNPVATPESKRRPRVGDIDPAEKDKYKTRFESKDNSIFGFGAAKGANLANDDVLYMITTGYEWQVGSTGAIPAEANFVFGDSTLYADAGLGFKHFFSDEDFSPFLKGTFGIGGASIQDTERINGFAFRASGGMTFFRTSSKHLELSASYGMLMKSSSRGTPSVLSVMMAVLY